MMFEAVQPSTGKVHRFRSLDALARRLGGDDWRVEHDPAFDPPVLTVMVTRHDRYGTHIVTCVRVPAEAFRSRNGL